MLGILLKITQVYESEGEVESRRQLVATGSTLVIAIRGHSGRSGLGSGVL